MKKNSKKTICQELKNKEMNPAVFKLRKKVMNLIYEASEIVPLPRIEVRITDNHETTLAVGRMRKNVIWVSERAVTYSEFDLRTIVFHELLHAVFGVSHDENCPLMKPIHSPLSKKECHRLFKRWATKSSSLGKEEKSKAS